MPLGNPCFDEFYASGFQELDLVGDDAVVYKLIGPVLVKQDLADAKQTVEKRLEYIRKEM